MIENFILYNSMHCILLITQTVSTGINNKSSCWLFSVMHTKVRLARVRNYGRTQSANNAKCELFWDKVYNKIRQQKYDNN